ncbi:MAG TPA: tetratricopeptide repeat protein [Planctomycetota bacterium]|jgi:tetratricopeptide (TPR) repeat protein|nr:tetratricopeptide repeat protein [Planctomycetota bacterium]
MNRTLRLLSLFPFLLASAPQDSRPDPQALRAEGERALARGDAAGALHAFEAALAADGSLPSRLGRARALLASERSNDALDELDRAEKDSPDSPEVSFLFARAFFAKGEKMVAERPAGARPLPFEDAARRDCFEEATRHLSGLLEKEPERAEAAALLARARLSLGDFDGADAALARAREADPKLPGLARLRGDAAFFRFIDMKQRGDGTEKEREKALQAARSAYEEAMRADPADARAARSLGDLHLWREKPEEAASAYGAALARDPTSVDLSLLASRLPDPLARRLFETCAAKWDAAHPDKATASASLWWYAGFYAYKAEDWKASRASFGKALAKNPALTNAHYYLAKAAYMQKDFDAAEASFAALSRAGYEGFAATVRQSTQAAADHDIVRFLADQAAREGREDAARDLFRGLAELAPDDADHWNNAAFFARNSGKSEDAYAWYRKALEIRPDDPQLLNAAAIILDYNLRRDLEEAKRLYKKAIECAERILKNRDASEQAKSEARTAKTDAENNLRRLETGGKRSSR